METQLLIGGKEVSATGGKTFDRLNPVTGMVATRAAACSIEDVRRRRSMRLPLRFQHGRRWDQARGAHYLNNAADALNARAAEFVSAMMDETASTSAWAHFNVMLAANMIREAAAM